MKSSADLVIVSPGNNRVIYQELSRRYAAVEPPVWAGLLANFCRKKGYGVDIIDQEARGLEPEIIAEQCVESRPKLVAVVVYGQQPSASTQNMTMAASICTEIKKLDPELKTVMVGGHPSALPERTLNESEADFVCQGEGPDTLDGLLQVDNLEDESQYSKVPGLWYRSGGFPAFTQPSPVIPQQELAHVLPGVAWDLLPMDAYRAHNWHCFAHIDEREPYAALYTSLGCPFRCSFCCINAPFGKPALRCWDPEFVITELDLLATKYNVKNVKIVDEMFVLNPSHVIQLCDLIIERGYDFNFWAYARVDTIKDHFLEKLKRAGFNWLVLGIESGSKHVRDGVEKGRFQEDDIYTIVKKTQEAGIYVLGNYIFGLPDEDYASMQATLDMSVELNCEWTNYYCGMAYPGSQLYHDALEKNWALPAQWHDFSQHSFEMLPLPSGHVPAEEIIAFRDMAWQIYFTNPRYLNSIRDKFGQEVVDHLTDLTKIELPRKYAKPPAVPPRFIAA